MAGFDEQPVYFSDPFGSSQDQGNDQDINRVQTQKRFKDFIRQFHEGTFVYPYRYVIYLMIMMWILLGLGLGLSNKIPVLLFAIRDVLLFNCTKL